MEADICSSYIQRGKESVYSLDGRKRLLQITDDIVDMLGADAQTDGALADAHAGQFLVRQLRVGRSGG